jgi:hypothetical protein
MSLQSAVPESFAKEATRAGWIAALASTALAVACYWLVAVTKSWTIFALYPLGLGALAVGAMNYRRWYGFWESMAACFFSVVDVCKILGALVGLYLFMAIIHPPAFLYFAIMLVCALFYFLGYILAGFAIAVATACAGGAVLYGLLLVMRYLGDKRPKENAPRPLRMMV